MSDGPDRQRFRREARRLANGYRNRTMDRAACIRSLYAAANAAGIEVARPRGKAELALRSLSYGHGDIEPGLFPRHLEALHGDGVGPQAYADGVRELLARLCTVDGAPRTSPR